MPEIAFRITGAKGKIQKAGGKKSFRRRANLEEDEEDFYTRLTYNYPLTKMLPMRTSPQNNPFDTPSRYEFTLQTAKQRLNIIARLALEFAFKMTCYPSHVDKQLLAKTCSMSYKQIETWFQNRRDRRKKQTSLPFTIDTLSDLRKTLEFLPSLTQEKITKVDSWSAQTRFDYIHSESIGKDPWSTTACSLSDVSNNSHSRSLYAGLDFEDSSPEVSETETSPSPSENDFEKEKEPRGNASMSAKLRSFVDQSKHSANTLFSFPSPQWKRRPRSRATVSNEASLLPASNISEVSAQFDVMSLERNKSNTISSQPTLKPVLACMQSKPEAVTQSTCSVVPQDIGTPGNRRTIAPLPRRRLRNLPSMN